MKPALAPLLALLAACSAPEPARLTGTARTPRELTVAWIGEPAGEGPVLVLLHGYGAPGDDLAPLGEDLRARVPGLSVALVAAPIDLGGGRAWWEISLDRRPADRSADHPAGMDEARADLEATLARLGLDPARTALAGFSQGGMLATELGLRARPRYAAVASLSGGAVDADAWVARAADAPPLFLAHGRRDPLLSYDAASRLHDRLAAAGARITWVPFDGGHAIPDLVVERLAAFLREIR